MSSYKGIMPTTSALISGKDLPVRNCVISSLTLYLISTCCRLGHVGEGGDYGWKHIYCCEDTHDSLLCQKMYYQMKTCTGKYPTLFLLIEHWFDDFEPNNNKSNRGSVYIRTVTFSPAATYRNNIQNTYPLVVGPKNCDKGFIDKRIQEEMENINQMDGDGKKKKFYCALLGCNIRVQVQTLAKMADQPERRATLGLGLGNSTFHARFGYIINLNELAKNIVPCTTCQGKLYAGEKDWDAVICEHCTQWRMYGNHPLLLFNVPDGFPMEELSEAESIHGKMYPKRLSLPMLREAVTKGVSKMSEGVWTQKKGRGYLRSFGLNDKWMDKIVRYSTGVLQMSRPRGNGVYDMSEEDLRYIESVELEYTHGIPMPSAWYDKMDFCQNLDVPMHLLFLGIVSSVMDMVVFWLKSQGKFSDFKRKVKGKLSGMQSMYINWLEVLEFSKKGGYVSANYLGLCRVSPWLFSVLELLEVDPEYADPTRPQTKWNKKENKAWLKARGLDTVGNAKKLRERVTDYFNGTNCVPAIKESTKVDVHLVQRLIRSMARTIALSMTERVSNAHLRELSFCVKRFLTDFENLDHALRPGRKKPWWVTMFNFSCLLNIIEAMWWLGPIRNFWEGSFKGEGFLRFVKSEINMGLRKGWQMALMNRLLRKKALSNILKEDYKKTTDTEWENAERKDVDDGVFEHEWERDSDSDEEMDEGPEMEDSNDEESNMETYDDEFKVYSNFEEISKLQQRNEAISGISLNNNTVAIVVGDRDTWIIGEFETGEIREENGLKYRKLYIDLEGIGTAANWGQAGRGYVLLPFLTLDIVSNVEQFYTAIRSDWMVLNAEASFEYIPL